MSNCLRNLIVLIAVVFAGAVALSFNGIAVAASTASPHAMPPAGSAPAPTSPGSDSFAEQVDLSQLGTIAVFYDGRIKSFDSYASQMMQFVTGPRQINGQSDAFTYLDMIFRPGQYENAPIIFVKKKPMRAQIVNALEVSFANAAGPAFEEEMAEFMETGLLSRRYFNDPEVMALLQRWQRDVIRTAKFVDEIETALSVSNPRVLIDTWRVIPPSHGDVQSPWLSFAEVMSIPPQGQAGRLPIEQEDHGRLLDAWQQFANAWMSEDAAAVNTSSVRLASLLPTINPELYPDRSRLGWESFYFRMKNFVWVWVLYGLALIPLLLATVFRWRGARVLGIGMFLLAFALHTFAIGLRWYVASRWPNSNMFEAVTTSAWFGGCGALVFELLVRRTPMRNIFFLASAAASMAALMAAHFFPLHLNPNITNMMPVLHDVWLYIHTNVIIFSYCLIFMAAISALLYLGYRGIGAFRNFGGPDDFARVGGAGSLIMTSPQGGSYITRAKTSIGQIFDGTTMVLMELSFILLWAGLVMGAIWADHSWGRPWGWDPKEVFALNTFIVFAVLIHTRMKVRDKGLWTAVLALIGAIVMLFNWIFINFHIVGLHSYA